MLEQFAIVSLQSVILVVAATVVAFYLTIIAAHAVYTVLSVSLKGFQLAKLAVTDRVVEYRESLKDTREPRISTKRTASYSQ